MEAAHDTMIVLYTKVLSVLVLFVAVTLVCNLARRIARHYVNVAFAVAPASTPALVPTSACLPRVSLRRYVQVLSDVVAHNINPIVIAEQRFGVLFFAWYIWTPEAGDGGNTPVLVNCAPEHRRALMADPAFNDALDALERDRTFRATGIPTANILLPLHTSPAG